MYVIELVYVTKEVCESTVLRTTQFIQRTKQRPRGSYGELSTISTLPALVRLDARAKNNFQTVDKKSLVRTVRRGLHKARAQTQLLDAVGDSRHEVKKQVINRLFL